MDCIQKCGNLTLVQRMAIATKRKLDPGKTGWLSVRAGQADLICPIFMT
jgi:hypothetical protein